MLDNTDVAVRPTRFKRVCHTGALFTVREISKCHWPRCSPCSCHRLRLLSCMACVSFSIWFVCSFLYGLCLLFCMTCVSFSIWFLSSFLYGLCLLFCMVSVSFSVPLVCRRSRAMKLQGRPAFRKPHIAEQPLHTRWPATVSLLLGGMVHCHFLI